MKSFATNFYDFESIFEIVLTVSEKKIIIIVIIIQIISQWLSGVKNN